jgi:hypothetical protein
MKSRVIKELIRAAMQIIKRRHPDNGLYAAARGFLSTLWGQGILEHEEDPLGRPEDEMKERGGLKDEEEMEEQAKGVRSPELLRRMRQVNETEQVWDSHCLRCEVCNNTDSLCQVGRRLLRTHNRACEELHMLEAFLAHQGGCSLCQGDLIETCETGSELYEIAFPNGPTPGARLNGAEDRSGLKDKDAEAEEEAEE